MSFERPIELKLTVKIFASTPSTNKSSNLRCLAIHGQLFDVDRGPLDPAVLVERILVEVTLK